MRDDCRWYSSATSIKGGGREENKIEEEEMKRVIKRGEDVIGNLIELAAKAGQRFLGRMASFSFSFTSFSFSSSFSFLIRLQIP